MNERGDITTNTTEIKRLLREYFELCANKYDKLNKIDKVLLRHKSPKHLRRNRKPEYTYNKKLNNYKIFQ